MPLKHVAVAVARGPRLYRGGIGTDIRFGQRERGNHVAGREFGQVGLFLFLRTVDQDALRADGHIGTESRTEGGRGVGDLVGHPHLLRNRQAQPAVFFGDRQAEQAHRLHLVDKGRRDRIRGVDLGLGRNQAFIDEALDRIDKLLKCFLVERHGVLSRMVWRTIATNNLRTQASYRQSGDRLCYDTCDDAREG